MPSWIEAAQAQQDGLAQLAYQSGQTTLSYAEIVLLQAALGRLLAVAAAAAEHMLACMEDHSMHTLTICKTGDCAQAMTEARAALADAPESERGEQPNG